MTLKNCKLAKYTPANNPINAPIRGNRNMYSEDVMTKSSVLPNGIIVRKESKSLKVFIAFIFDIYPTLTQIGNIDFVVKFMAQLEGKKILVTGGAGFIGFHLCTKLSVLTPNINHLRQPV